MNVQNKATRIDLFSLKTPQMRAFHMSWFAFFLCFFAWFGIAPLIIAVEEELGLTKQQIGNTVIASVAITIVARLLIGWLCDHVGPRISYTILLMVGSIPVMCIGLAHSYEAFLLYRLGIGVIGASFVITQYHTSVMFAPNCVGTANATSAGWGNLGGGVTNMVMPLVMGAFIGMGYLKPEAWRLSMLAAGAVCFVTGIAYFFVTTDLPNGNFKKLRERGEIAGREKTSGTFWIAAKDGRVWALFMIYAACFGIELTINNVAARYYFKEFELSMAQAGLIAGLFGLMNLFARTTGGIIGDKFGHKNGLRGRVRWLFIALFIEGLALILFSRMEILHVAIASMILFSLFVQMSEGATYSVVPFINKKALGSVAGIVGAGGNMGAVAAGFLFRSEALSYQDAFLILGGLVLLFSFFTFFVRFSTADEATARTEHTKALEVRAAIIKPKPRFELPTATATKRRVTPLTLLRVYIGVALMIKGIFLIANMEELDAQMGEGMSQNMRAVIAWFVVLAHGVGGAALALGFVTRLSSLINAIVLAGAVVMHLSDSGGGVLGTDLNFQFASLVLIVLVVFIWQGSGRFSLDRLLRSSDPG